MRWTITLPMALIAGTAGFALTASAQMAEYGSHAAVDGNVDRYTLETVDDAEAANLAELRKIQAGGNVYVHENRPAEARRPSDDAFTQSSQDLDASMSRTETWTLAE